MALSVEASASAELRPHERSRPCPAGQMSAATSSVGSSPQQALLPAPAANSLYETELHSAVRKQIQVLEDSVSTHLSGMKHDRSRLCEARCGVFSPEQLQASVSVGNSITDRSGSAAAQAALAAALEACVARLAESEAWIAAVDVEVRSLRADSDRAGRTSANIAARLEELGPKVAGHETSIRELNLHRPAADRGHHVAAWVPQRVEHLEALINNLSFKIDASDEEIEQLKARNDLATRRELVEVAATLEADVSRLTDRIVRGESVLQVARKDFDGMREEFGDLLVRTADSTTRQELIDALEPLRREVILLNARTSRAETRELHASSGAASRQELAEAIEPLVQRLAQLSEEKASRDVHEAKTDDVEMRKDHGLREDLLMAKACSKVPNDEKRAEQEGGSDAERVQRELRSELRSAVAELSDTTELLKLELKALADKAAHGANAPTHQDLEDAVRHCRAEMESSISSQATAATRVALAGYRRELAEAAVPAVEPASRQELVETTHLLKQEIGLLSEKVARGTSRQDLQEATRLLAEVQDANRLLRMQLHLATGANDTAAATRQELVTLSHASGGTPASTSPGFSGVSRQELVDATALLHQEVELLARRIDSGADTMWVSRHEFAEAVKLLRQELPVLVQKASKTDDVVKRQELIDAAEILKHELRNLTEKSPQQAKGAVTQQELADALGALRHELIGMQLPPEAQANAALGSPLMHMADSRTAASQAVAAAERAQRCAASCAERAERDNAVAQMDRASFERQLGEIEERLKARCLADISRLADNQRCELDSIERSLRQQLQLHSYKTSMVDGTQRYKSEEREQSMADALLGRITSLCDRLSTVEGAVAGLGGSSSTREVKTKSSHDSFSLLSPSKDSMGTGLDTSRHIEPSAIDHIRFVGVEESCSDVSMSASKCGGETRLCADEPLMSSSPRKRAFTDGFDADATVKPLAIHLARRATPPQEKNFDVREPSSAQLEELYRKVDRLSADVSNALSRSPSPRSLGDQGVAQLLAEVKKTQANENSVVEALLLRVGSLCDRVSNAEDRLREATTGAVQDLVEKILAATVAELGADDKDAGVDSVVLVLDKRIDRAVRDRVAWELEQVEGLAQLDQMGEQIEKLGEVGDNLDVIQEELASITLRLQALESLRCSRPSLGFRKKTVSFDDDEEKPPDRRETKRRTVADMLGSISEMPSS